MIVARVYHSSFPASHGLSSLQLTLILQVIRTTALMAVTSDMDKDIEIRKDPASLIASASVEDITVKARAAADEEHNHSFWTAVKLYPAAVGWSLFFSIGVIM